MRPTGAFTTVAPTVSVTTFRGNALCDARQTCQTSQKPARCQPRMEAVNAVERQQPPTINSVVETPTNWPPPEMTDEWAEAVLRLVNSVKGVSLESADEALGDADGDEMLALKYLVEENRSEIQKRRERTVEAARAAGDIKRVSAVKEAELRRVATGSARDFFKGFVDVEGQYVDAGYVDEGADAMGTIMGKVKGWFGNNE